MDENQRQLRKLAEELLTLEHPGDLRGAAVELHALFSALTGLREDSCDREDIEPTPLPGGLAIDPLSAARCLLDFARTAAFLRGLCRAVEVARQRFSARPIEILYAGCGPFAPLAIPLMTRFGEGDVRFILLDVHRRSLDVARGLVETFGYGAHVRDYVRADAAEYLHPADAPLHLVLTETMQLALTKEPQVGIVLNLAPRLDEGGILIPERVTVDACLYDPATEFQPIPAGMEEGPFERPERVRIALGRLLELDLESARRHRQGDGFAPVRLVLPETGGKPLPMMLRTQVTVFGEIGLGDYDSGITCPHPLGEVDTSRAGCEVEFRYEMGSDPGFRVRTVDAGEPGSAV